MMVFDENRGLTGPGRPRDQLEDCYNLGGLSDAPVRAGRGGKAKTVTI